MADLVLPSAQLGPIGIDGFAEKVGDLNDAVGFSQYISPAYWVGELAAWVLGKNPWEMVAELLAGDWESVAVTAVALDDLANYSTAYADTLRSQTGPLFTRFWTGNAAAQANGYFAKLEQTMRDQAQPLRDMSKQVWELALAVNQMADLMKGLVEELVDLIITAGLGNLAKGVSLAVDASSYAKYYAVLKRIYAIADELIENYDKMVDLTKFFLSLISGYTATLRGMTLPALTQSAYDNPRV